MDGGRLSFWLIKILGVVILDKFYLSLLSLCFLKFTNLYRGEIKWENYLDKFILN